MTRTDVLRFNIGVDKIAFVMEVLKTEKHLLRDDLDERSGYALRLVALDEGKQVFAERLKDDADVGLIGARMREGIEEGDDEVTTWVLRARGHDLAQKLDLVARSLRIPAC